MDCSHFSLSIIHMNITAEDLIMDLHNFYGERADVFQAVEYMSNTNHPTPGGFHDWLKATRRR